LSPHADYSARGVKFRGLETSFNAYRRGQALGGFTVKMPGAHNVLNCLATIAVADELEVPLDVIKQALSTFGGVARRFTVIGTPRDVMLIDDYGHHPAEVRATIEAARRAFPEEGRRIIVAFQPHRYTRTRDLFDDFTRAFNQADILFLTDIYAAGEAPIEGITSEHLARSIRQHGHHDVTHVADKMTLHEAIGSVVRRGDIVIALGAGDVNKMLPRLRTFIDALPEDKPPPREGAT
jgi:UDP-N-acetylmuramate--alanine ligase